MMQALPGSATKRPIPNRPAGSLLRPDEAMLAVVSHELRSPLTAIMGYVDLLLESVGDADVADRRDSLEIVRRNTEYLLELVSDLLDLSQLESGRMKVTPVEFSPAELARDAVALMSVRARTKQLSLQIDGLDGLPATIRTDGVRLKQILLNLLSNALKFTDRGFVRLEVGCDVRGGRTCLRCSVCDSGIGMTPEQLSRLFRPFEQVAEESRHRRGGSGLGLTLCRNLATALGGTLEVDSVRGTGSRFTLTIPIDVVRN